MEPDQNSGTASSATSTNSTNSDNGIKQPYVSLLVYKAKWANFKPRQAYLVLRSTTGQADADYQTPMQIASYVRQWPLRYIIKLQEQDLRTGKLIVEVWRIGGRLKGTSCIKSFDIPLSSLALRHARSETENLYVDGPLELFMEATGPRHFVDLMSRFDPKTVSSNNPDDHQALLYVLEDFSRIIKQDKHKVAAYIDEDQIIKLLSEYLIHFQPTLDPPPPPERPPDADRQAQPTPASPSSPKSKSPASPPKRSPAKKKKKNNDSDSSNSSDSDDDDSSLLSSSDSDSNSNSDSSSEEAAAKRAERQRQRAAKEAERAAFQLAQESHRKVLAYRAQLKRLILDIFKALPTIDVSLLRRLIASRFLIRICDLLARAAAASSSGTDGEATPRKKPSKGSREPAVDQESQLALLNALKPFFTVRAHQRTLLDAGLLPILVKFVRKSPYTAIKFAAFDILLYFDEVHQKELLKSGVLSAVLKLLRDDSCAPAMRSRALELVSFFNANYQKDLVNAGVLKQLVALMKVSESSVQPGSSSSSILSSLLLKSLNFVHTFEKKHQRDLVKEGILDRLLNLVMVKDERLQETCLTLLNSFQNEFMPELVDGGFLQKMCSLLAPKAVSSRKISSLVYSTIYKLLTSNDNAEFVRVILQKLREAGILPLLIKDILGSVDADTSISPSVRFAAFILIYNLHMTKAEIQETGAMAVFKTFLSWQHPNYEVLHVVSGGPFAWLCGLDTTVATIHYEITPGKKISGVTLAAALAIVQQFIDQDRDILAHEESRPALDALCAMFEQTASYKNVPGATGITPAFLSYEGIDWAAQVLDILIACANLESLHEYLVSTKQLVANIIALAMRTGKVVHLEKLEKITNWTRALRVDVDGAPLAAKFLRLMWRQPTASDEWYAVAKKTAALLRNIEREEWQSMEVISSLVFVFQEKIYPDICLDLLTFLPQIPEFASLLQKQTLIGLKSVVPITEIVNFAMAEPDAIRPTLQLLFKLAQSQADFSSFAERSDVATFLFAIISTAAKAPPEPVVIEPLITPEESSSSSTPPPPAPPSEFNLLPADNLRDNPNKPKLGSARGRAAAAASATTQPSKPVITTAPTADSSNLDDLRAFALFCHLAANSSSGGAALSSFNFEDVVNAPLGELASNLRIYDYFITHTAELSPFIDLMDRPRLHPRIRLALVEFIRKCPVEYRKVLFSVSAMERAVFAVADMSSEPASEEFCVAMIRALSALGSVAASSLKRFLTTFETFVKLFTQPPSVAIRSAAVEWFQSMPASDQHDLVDLGFISTVAEGLKADAEKASLGAPLVSLESLQRPVLELLAGLEDKYFFLLTTSVTSSTNDSETKSSDSSSAPSSSSSSSGTTNLILPTKYNMVHQWMGKTLNWRLIYRASRDGWNEKVFLEKCSDCGPNLVFAESENGACFGGYTSRSWKQDGQQLWVSDVDAFLFSISPGAGQSRGPVHMPVKESKATEAIYVSKAGLGPTFGEGHDLVIDVASKRHRGMLGYTYQLPKGQSVVTSTFWNKDPANPLNEVEIYGLAQTNAPLTQPDKAKVANLEQVRQCLLPRNVATVINDFVHGRDVDGVFKGKLAEHTADVEDDLFASIPENEDSWELAYRSPLTSDGPEDYQKLLAGHVFNVIESQPVPSFAPSSSMIILITLSNGAVFGAYSGRLRSVKVAMAWHSDPTAFLFSIAPPVAQKQQQQSRPPTILPRLTASKFCSDPAQYSVMLTDDGIAFGQGIDLFINLVNPRASYSNLGFTYSAREVAPFSPEAQSFLAGSPSDWDIKELEIFTPLPETERKALSKTARICGNLRAIMRLLPCYSNKSALREILSGKIQKLIESNRLKVIAEMQRMIVDPLESPAVKTEFKPQLAVVNLPDLSIVPYKLISVGGKQIADDSVLNLPSSSSSGAERDFSISSPVLLDSTQNILLEFDAQRAVEKQIQLDQNEDPPFVSHLLIGADILGGDPVLLTVPMRRILIFASDKPIDETELDRFNKPHVAMDHDPDDVKAADDLRRLQEWEDILEEEQADLLDRLQHAVVVSHASSSSSSTNPAVAPTAGEESLVKTELTTFDEKLARDVNAFLDSLLNDDEFAIPPDNSAESSPQTQYFFSLPPRTSPIAAGAEQSSSPADLIIPDRPSHPHRAAASPNPAISRSMRAASRPLRVSTRNEQGQLMPVGSITFTDSSYGQVVLKFPFKAKYILLKVFANPTKHQFHGAVTVSRLAVVCYTPPNAVKPQSQPRGTWPYPSHDALAVSNLKMFMGPSSIMHEAHFAYQSNFDRKGFIWWLGTQMGVSPRWSNPATVGKIQVSLSHNLFNQQTMRQSDVLNGYAEPTVCFWGGSVPIWVMVDLGIFSLNLTHYTVRHGYSHSNSFMKDFVFEGSNDGVHWETVHQQQQAPFSTAFDTATFAIVPSTDTPGAGKSFRFFRLFQRGHYYMGPKSTQKSAPFLCVNGIEFYGTVRFEENLLADTPLFADRYTAMKSLEESVPDADSLAANRKEKEKEKFDDDDDSDSKSSILDNNDEDLLHS